MFRDAICSTIDQLQNHNFENGRITINAFDHAHFFLYELGNFNSPFLSSESFCKKYPFHKFYHAEGLGRIPGLSNYDVKGLILLKTEENSIGTKINPKCLQDLKKQTHAYLTALAQDWKLVSTNTSLKDDTKVEVIRKRTNIDINIHTTLCILGKIANIKGLFDKILIHATQEEFKLKGDWKHIKKFHEYLVKEAIDKKTSSLFQLTCVQISCNIKEYQKKEEYQYLPKCILKEIQKYSLFKTSIPETYCHST